MDGPQQVDANAEANAIPEEASPAISRWKNVYVGVAVELAATVALLYALTRWAS